MPSTLAPPFVGRSPRRNHTPGCSSGGDLASWPTPGVSHHHGRGTCAWTTMTPDMRKKRAYPYHAGKACPGATPRQAHECVTE